MTAVPPGAVEAAAGACPFINRDALTRALQAAAPHITAAEGELLAEAADALWECAKAALTVKPTLDTPYPDAPEWTPYTRWVERPAWRAHDLAMRIRKHLRVAEGTP